MLANVDFFGGVLTDLSAEVDGIVVGNDTAHALFGVLALDHDARMLELLLLV